MIEIGRCLIQAPLGARLVLGTQPCYEAPGDLQLENLTYAMINLLLNNLLF